MGTYPGRSVSFDIDVEGSVLLAVVILSEYAFHSRGLPQIRLPKVAQPNSISPIQVMNFITCQIICTVIACE